MGTSYRTNPGDWPDPLLPRRPVPSILVRLREMQAEAIRSSYGANDRQGLMLNPAEIEQLLALLEQGTSPAEAPDPGRRPMPTHEIDLYVRIRFEGIDPSDAWSRARDAAGLEEGQELVSRKPRGVGGGTRRGVVKHVRVLRLVPGELDGQTTEGEQ